jgi:hypothetical protein
MIRRAFNRLGHAFLGGVLDQLADLRDELCDLKLLQGTQAALAVSQLETLPMLGAASFHVTSQWGEDGIIEWLVSKLPMLKPSFVEFGVGYYVEANTLFLLQRRNWRGLVADISDHAVDGIRKSELMWQRDLTAVHRQITRDNINGLFTENGFAGEIGILSIDIDGNDYWIWNAITVSNPGIVICEYNGIFGDIHPLTVPPDDNFDRTSKHHSNLYWGASVAALEHLAANKGYTLIGSNIEGCNAFFVRNDIASHVTDRIVDKRARVPLYREARDEHGEFTFPYSVERSRIISAMPVVDVKSGEQSPLSRYEGSLYSEYWLSTMNGH